MKLLAAITTCIALCVPQDGAAGKFNFCMYKGDDLCRTTKYRSHSVRHDHTRGYNTYHRWVLDAQPGRYKVVPPRKPPQIHNYPHQVGSYYRASWTPTSCSNTGRDPTCR